MMHADPMGFILMPKILHIHRRTVPLNFVACSLVPNGDNVTNTSQPCPPRQQWFSVSISWVLNSKNIHRIILLGRKCSFKASRGRTSRTKGVAKVFWIPAFESLPGSVLLSSNPRTTSLNLNLLVSEFPKTIKYINIEPSKLGSNAKNYFDAVRTNVQNPEGLHCANQKQYACPEWSCRRSAERVLWEA